MMFLGQAAVDRDVVRARTVVKFAPASGLVVADILALALAFVFATSVNEIIQTRLHRLASGEFYAPYLEERIATVSFLTFGVLVVCARETLHIAPPLLDRGQAGHLRAHRRFDG